MPNAFLFVGVGLLMEVLHQLPEITGVREMWLMVMGGVLILTGGIFLTQATWLWVKPRLVTPLLVLLPRREEARGRPVPDGRRASV